MRKRERETGEKGTNPERTEGGHVWRKGRDLRKKENEEESAKEEKGEPSGLERGRSRSWCRRKGRGKGAKSQKERRKDGRKKDGPSELLEGSES